MIRSAIDKLSRDLRGKSVGRVVRSQHFAPAFPVAFILLVMIALASQVQAASINYGNFSAVSVDFLDVQEDANSAGDVPPLFGPPTVSGDSLDFDPVGFGASATGAFGVDITDGNLSFDVMAKPNNIISNMLLAEAGDVTLLGFGTDATFAAVFANVFVDIHEVDGVPINTISRHFSMTFTPSGGTYGQLTDGGGGPLYSDDWSGGVFVDVDGILTSENLVYLRGATKISINLDNTLVALSQAGTFSLIAKKDFGVSVRVNLPGGGIPEPTSFVLLSLAGLVVVGCRRRIVMDTRRA
jgi:hypothetical protein